MFVPPHSYFMPPQNSFAPYQAYGQHAAVPSEPNWVSNQSPFPGQPQPAPSIFSTNTSTSSQYYAPRTAARAVPSWVPGHSDAEIAARRSARVKKFYNRLSTLVKVNIFTVSLPSVLSHFLAQSSFPRPIASFQLVSGRLGDPSLKHVLRWCSLHYRYSPPAWCGRSPTTSWTRMTAPCGICSRIRCAWGSTSHIWWQPSRGAFSSNATATSRNISVAMLASIRFGVDSLGPQIMKISVPIVCTTTTTTF